MNKEKIGNVLRGTGVACLFAAATAIGATAYGERAEEPPFYMDRTVQLSEEKEMPVVELAGHILGLAGIAQVEGGKRLSGPSDPGSGPA